MDLFDKRILQKKLGLLQLLLKTLLAMVERPAKSREGWGLFISGLPNEDLEIVDIEWIWLNFCVQIFMM